MVTPRRAAVRPRVISPETGDPILLEDEIAALAQCRPCGAIELVGPSGAGKSTALAHLAEVLLPDARILLLDDPPEHDIFEQAKLRLVVFAASLPRKCAVDLKLRLTSWSNDDFIEYLLAACPQHCASVMQRLRGAADRELLAGVPELCRVVLDQMACDASLLRVRDALQRELATQLPTPALQSAARRYALACLLGTEKDAAHRRRDLETADCAAAARRLLEHQPIKALLAAEQIVAEATAGNKMAIDPEKRDRQVVLEAARLLQENKAARRAFNALLKKRRHRLQPLAASILVACDAAWKPTGARTVLLKNALLAGADWPGVRLAGVDLQHADLRNANLDQANLTGASAERANFSRAQLTGAVLNRIGAAGANFFDADLRRIIALKAIFHDADFQSANLRHANLTCASLSSANLEGASLHGANLRRTRLGRARIAGLDLTAANLEEASLVQLPLRAAQLDGACFGGALLMECDLEFVSLPNAKFARANLYAALLTGSVLPRADFQQANLTNAGLADVEWEEADLRGADLRGASFHLGSTRSGLVGSPFPSHGTRTGFYTDDLDEQHFKAPEEIRKANLCGADLRGAKIDNVDFYLVDLRGALYDRSQAEHFRRCGAIL